MSTVLQGYEVMHRFYFHVFFSALHFHGHSCPSIMIIYSQPQTWCASGRGCGNGALRFFCCWATGMVPLGAGALPYTLRIKSGGTAYTHLLYLVRNHVFNNHMTYVASWWWCWWVHWRVLCLRCCVLWLTSDKACFPSDPWCWLRFPWPLLSLHRFQVTHPPTTAPVIVKMTFKETIGHFTFYNT